MILSSPRRHSQRGLPLVTSWDLEAALRVLFLAVCSVFRLVPSQQNRPKFAVRLKTRTLSATAGKARSPARTRGTGFVPDRRVVAEHRRARDLANATRGKLSLSAVVRAPLPSLQMPGVPRAPRPSEQY